VNALRIGLVVLLALAAALAANLVLLGVAAGSHDPVGRLSPRAELITLPATTAPAATTTAPATAAPGQARHRSHEQRPGEREDD
jgi:hypothetical protein